MQKQADEAARPSRKRLAARKPEWQQKTAMERILLLFDSAEREFRQRPDRSRRYMELASKIAMRYNIRLEPRLKRRFCKRCYMYLVPGASCRARLGKRHGNMTITCSACGNVHRYPAAGGGSKHSAMKRSRFEMADMHKASGV